MRTLILPILKASVEIPMLVIVRLTNKNDSEALFCTFGLIGSIDVVCRSFSEFGWPLEFREACLAPLEVRLHSSYEVVNPKKPHQRKQGETSAKEVFSSASSPLPASSCGVPIARFLQERVFFHAGTSHPAKAMTRLPCRFERFTSEASAWTPSRTLVLSFRGSGSPEWAHAAAPNRC